MTTIVDDGIGAVAGLINGSITSYFDYMALGTDDTEESTSDTELGDEITSNGGSRAQGTTSRETDSITDDTAVVSHTWTFDGSLSVKEAGLFDSDSGGTMLLRHVFASTKNVDDGDEMDLTFKVTVSR